MNKSSCASGNYSRHLSFFLIEKKIKALDKKKNLVFKNAGTQWHEGHRKIIKQQLLCIATSFRLLLDAPPQAEIYHRNKFKLKMKCFLPHMFSVFCASHSRLHWPVALRWRASLSSSICSRSFFQRRYSALSRPVIDMVMSIEPFCPGLRLYRDRRS